jgi:hypothetical protein
MIGGGKSSFWLITPDRCRKFAGCILVRAATILHVCMNQVIKHAMSIYLNEAPSNFLLLHLQLASGNKLASLEI